MKTKIFKIITISSCICLNVLLNEGLKQLDSIEIPSSEKETIRIERVQIQDRDQDQGVLGFNLTGTPVGVEVILDSILFT